MIKFYSFRLNLIKADNLFNFEKTKEEYFNEVLIKLVSEKKMTFSARNAKFILYFYKELDKDIYCCELAKEETQTIPIEGELQIEEETITKTPFVYVIIDKSRQIVLIQDKSSVFSDINSSRGKIEYFFTNKLREVSITTYLEPITDNKEFWNEVSKADAITELDITFIAPNMFRGRHKAEDLVAEVYEDFNITEFEVKLKNKLGKLKLLKENLGSFIKLIADGAGKYVLKTKRNGKKEDSKSYEIIKTKSYTAENPQEIEKEELNNDLSDLDKLNEENNNHSN